jgi:uncharacterized protein (DUF305 family)
MCEANAMSQRREYEQILEIEMASNGKRFCLAASVALGWLASTPSAYAQHSDHSAHAAPSTAAAKPLTDASKEYEAAMMRMHKDMTIPYSNDVDVDFVRGMIPHHQGAIDQAKILLKYSKNPRLRRLAGGIIAAQKREIAFMQKWIDAREKGSEMEMPEWLKNTEVPDDVRNPAIDK